MQSKIGIIPRPHHVKRNRSSIATPYSPPDSITDTILSIPDLPIITKPTKLKIAYCFGGHVRTFEQCFPTFQKHIFSKAPGDIFIHTWNELTSMTPSWWNKEPRKKQPLPREKVLELYKPKSYIIEESRAILPIPCPDPWVSKYGHAAKHSYESALKTFNLAKSHGPYDMYFLIRFDLSWQSDLDMKEMQDTKYLYMNKFTYLNKQGAYSDIFSFGNKENTEKRLNWYWYIDQNYYLKANSISHEYEMSNYYKKEKLPIKISQLKYGLQRDTGHLHTLG